MSRSAIVFGPVESGQCASWELVRLAQRGDTEAFGVLYRRYRHRVLQYLVPRTADRSLAEDLTSETFLRAFAGLSTLRRQERPVQAWLITIARNLVMDEFRSVRHRSEVLTGTFYEGQLVEHELEGHIVQQLEFERVRRHMADLSEEHRRCIELRFMYQLDTAEAARLMNRKSGALRALQRRAVQRLAALCTIENQGNDERCQNFRTERWIQATVAPTGRP